MNAWPWSVLQIGETSDKSAIRRAYATRLKALDVDREMDTYAALRTARDRALALADTVSSGEMEKELDLHDPDELNVWDSDEGWGAIDSDTLVTITPGPEQRDGEAEDAGDDEWAIPSIDSIRAAHQQDVAAEDRSADHNVLDKTEEGDGVATSQWPPDDWQDFVDILLPQGEHSDEGMDENEFVIASGALERLIDEAESGDINRHDTIENHMADVLAQAWPRSAPLVMRAADAFHWAQKRGALDESAPLIFLNARIAGMKFYEAVTQPEHRLNKAWVELSRLGKRNIVDQFLVKQNKIDDLISYIRENHPELINHLDEDRVRSWQSAASNIMIIAGIFVKVFIAVVAFSFFVAWLGTDREELDRPKSDAYMERFARLDARIEEVFGQGYDFQLVEKIDPKISIGLRIDVLISQDSPYYSSIHHRIRQDIMNAKVGADQDMVVRILKLKKSWIDASQYDWCEPLHQKALLGSPDLLKGDAQIEEQKLARALLEQGLLSAPESDTDRVIPLPDWLVREVLSQSGLDLSSFERALANPEDRNRCAVEELLIEIVLADPERVPIETLRGL